MKKSSFITGGSRGTRCPPLRTLPQSVAMLSASTIIIIDKAADTVVSAMNGQVTKLLLLLRCYLPSPMLIQLFKTVDKELGSLPHWSTMPACGAADETGKTWTHPTKSNLYNKHYRIFLMRS